MRNAFPIGMLAVIVLNACSKGEADGRPAFEIVARVNEQAIQANELESIQANGVPGRGDDEAMLERLIDQELMVQQARERQLDRDPRVLKSLEAARREILARAYLEQVTDQSPPPSDREIKDFYVAHPELFAKRRIYSLEELEVDVPAARYDELRERVTGAANLQEVTDWLTREGIAFRRANAVRPAEELPFESLKGFARMKDGQMLLSRTQGGALLVRLAASRSLPLDEASARPLIERYLANARKAALVKAEVERLRDRARIEYPEPAAAPDRNPGVPLLNAATAGADRTPAKSPVSAGTPDGQPAPGSASH